ncbi:MAG: ABC transporter permease [Puniceicoccales bacterium]|jgi:lipoprotein-releasing system permease protein|nr:ABC transporter permease [Puniceicoccales bacterium]
MLHYAWRQLFPRGGGLFFPLATLGVAMGVAVLVTVLSIMDGFQDEIRRRLLLFHGEVAVLTNGPSLREVDAVRNALEAVEGVVAAIPFYETFLLLEHGGNYAFPLAVGLEEEWTDVADWADGAVSLGGDVAEQLIASEGDELLALSPAQVLSNLEGEEKILPTTLRVVSVPLARRDGSDSQRVFLPMETLSALCLEAGTVSGFELRLCRGMDADAVAKNLREHVLGPGLRAITWREANRSLLSALALERAAMFFSMAFIVAVAAFAMGSFLSAHTARKTKEMGLLVALGCTRVRVAICFFLQSTIVGLCGIFAGLALGATLLFFRDPILRLVIGVFGREERIFDYYNFTQLPMALHVGEIFKIVAFALLTAIAAGLLPVFRVLRLDASTALRREN